MQYIFIDMKTIVTDSLISRHTGIRLAVALAQASKGAAQTGKVKYNYIRQFSFARQKGIHDASVLQVQQLGLNSGYPHSKSLAHYLHFLCLLTLFHNEMLLFSLELQTVMLQDHYVSPVNFVFSVSVVVLQEI